MTLTVQQHAVFLERTSQAFQKHKRRAREAGQFIDYRLEDLHAYVLNNLGEQKCFYCRGPVGVESFALDHKNPPARGGSYAFHNLAIACAGCHAAKGDLDYIEYKELLGLLRTWSPFVRTYLLGRLRRETAGRLELPSSLVALIHEGVPAPACPGPPHDQHALLDSLAL